MCRVFLVFFPSMQLVLGLFSGQSSLYSYSKLNFSGNPWKGNVLKIRAAILLCILSYIDIL